MNKVAVLADACQAAVKYLEENNWPDSVMELEMPEDMEPATRKALMEIATKTIELKRKLKSALLHTIGKGRESHGRSEQEVV